MLRPALVRFPATSAKLRTCSTYFFGEAAASANRNADIPADGNRCQRIRAVAASRRCMQKDDEVSARRYAKVVRAHSGSVHHSATPLGLRV